MDKGEGFFIWAHRGVSAHAPENTMSAFQAADEAGADGIELDVHLSRDGVPVVIHDETVDRTTDGRGPVAAMTAEELRRLDAGSWFSPSFADEPVPTLEEVLAWAPDRLRINVEIKAVAAGLAVLDLLRSYPRTRVLVSSFNYSLLERMRVEAPDLPLAFLVDSHFWRRALRRGTLCGAESFHPRFDLLSRPMVAACRREGMAVYGWTVDDAKSCLRLQRMGADGVFTNDPAAIIRHLRQSFTNPAAGSATQQ